MKKNKNEETQATVHDVNQSIAGISTLTFAARLLRLKNLPKKIWRLKILSRLFVMAVPHTTMSMEAKLRQN